MSYVSRFGAACVVLIGMLAITAPLVSGEPILAGEGSETYAILTAERYNALSPRVEIGTSGDGIEFVHEPYSGGPIVRVFQIINATVRHDLNLIEHWEVVRSSIDGWYAILMVPDGDGGWTPSGNYDDLWWSCRADVTPWPVVAPQAALVEAINRPDDVMRISWDPSLPNGTQIAINEWVTVPAGMTTFAIFEFPTAVPEPASLGLLGVGLGIMAACVRPGSKRSRR